VNDLVIVGAGGFGREVADVVSAINAEAQTFNLIGFVDDGPSPEDVAQIDRLGIPLVGSVSEVLTRPASGYVLGIGSGATRRLLDRQFQAAGWTATELVHPLASVGANVVLGPGTILCAGVRLTTNIRLGRHVHVNLNSTIGHDTLLLDYVTVNPLVAISGNVTVGEASMLGTHSAVLQNLTIGRDSVVGGGALVVRCVPDCTVVKGVPAR
jgi:sugar O-acyltransferase (sialic acid O-acetyltransferase NeuD family)